MVDDQVGLLGGSRRALWQMFRVTLFQEHFFMIKAGAVTMIPGRRGERDVFGG
jgi:hypothetical protein